MHGEESGMTKWIRLAEDGATIDAVYCVEPASAVLSSFIVAGDDVLGDWRYVDGAFVPPPPPPPPVPESISDRQFAMEARDRGYITQAEALAFVSTGTLPAALVDIITALPTPEARDDAELLLAGATVFERSHPLTLQIGNAMRGDEELETFLDGFFSGAGAR